MAKEYQTGVALAQWARDKRCRQVIKAPKGFKLCEFDAAGQEFRWMAVASGDPTMLEMCAPGEDSHSFMGSRVANVDYRKLVADFHAEVPEAINNRKLGKFCIAEGELVLTDQGLVPIEQITLAHKVWDGRAWVDHDGVIYQGVKEVVQYAGLVATPDHKVYLDETTAVEFNKAAYERAGIAKTGHSVHPLDIRHGCVVHGSEYGPSPVGKRKVYDIANAGQYHRFTVSGVNVANCNLGFQYRVGVKKATAKARVEYGLDVRQPYVKHLIDVYKSTYHEVPNYWKSQIMNCRELGYAETFAGRRINLKGDWFGKEQWPLESTSINFPIQGTGADQKYLAIHVLRDYMRKVGGYFYYELHDGLFYLLPEDRAETIAREVKEILLNLPYKQVWGVDLPIQFPWDAAIGDDWGHLKEIQD